MVERLEFCAGDCKFVDCARASTSHAGGGNPLQDFAEALRFVRSQPRLQDLLILVVLVTFFGISILNIMPAFASAVLGGDAQTLGLVLAASGAGALVSVLFVIPFVQAAKRTGIVLTSAVIWMGFWLVVTSQTRTAPLAMAGLFMYSIGAPAVIATSLGISQMMAPPDMRARLVSLLIMVSFGFQPLASLYVGFTAQIFGVPTAILLNGILLFSGGVLMMTLRAPLRAWSAGHPPAAAKPVTGE